MTRCDAVEAPSLSLCVHSAVPSPGIHPASRGHGRRLDHQHSGPLSGPAVTLLHVVTGLHLDSRLLQSRDALRGVVTISVPSSLFLSPSLRTWPTRWPVGPGHLAARAGTTPSSLTSFHFYQPRLLCDRLLCHLSPSHHTICPPLPLQVRQSATH